MPSTSTPASSGMVRVRDVAHHAGVSAGSVSNVLNGRSVRPDIAERVEASILQLGYVRNDSARQLRSGRSRLVGLLVHDIRNPGLAELAQTVEVVARRRGLFILFGSFRDASDVDRYLDFFEEQHAVGVIAPSGTVPEDRARALLDRGIPVIAVDAAILDASEREARRLAKQALLSGLLRP